MSNRCLGIILGHVTGHSSFHVQQVTGYPPPWTMLDAQVYLGMNGIGLGVGIDWRESIESMPDQLFIPEGLNIFPLGCIALAPTGNGETITLKRDQYSIVTPLLHCLLYRGNKWFDPQGDETLKEILAPEKVYQIWPMYQVTPKKDMS